MTSQALSPTITSSPILPEQQPPRGNFKKFVFRFVRTLCRFCICTFIDDSTYLSCYVDGDHTSVTEPEEKPKEGVWREWHNHNSSDQHLSFVKYYKRVSFIDDLTYYLCYVEDGDHTSVMEPEGPEEGAWCVTRVHKPRDSSDHSCHLCNIRNFFKSMIHVLIHFMSDFRTFHVGGW